MKFSPKLKLLIVFLLPLSLAWKSAIRINYTTNAQVNVAEFLLRHHFNISKAQEIMQHRETFKATSFSCQMLVTPVSHLAWERDAIERHAKEDDQVFFVFRGKVYAKYPTWSASFAFLGYKLMSEIGVRLQQPSAVVVVATKSCNAKQLPWDNLDLYREGNRMTVPR